jgi:hypothetical protein
MDIPRKENDMTLIPSTSLIIYDSDDIGSYIKDTILTGELVEVTLGDNVETVVGVLYDVYFDEIWIDTSKGYGEHYRKIRSCDITAIARKEWDPEDLKER